MPVPCDYKRFAVLYVDAEEKSLKNFRLLCEDQFRVLTAPNAREGLKLLERHLPELGLIVANQCSRAESGVWLLERARELRAAIPRLLLSDGCNWQANTAARQSGVATRIVLTPWDPGEFEATIRTELELFMLRRERDQLLEDLRMMLQDRVTSLRILAAGLNRELRDLLQAPRIFVERVPMHLQASGVNLANLSDREFWQDLYGHVKAQFARIDEVLNTLRVASEEPPQCVADRAKLREIIHRELGHLKAELEARQMTVEDFIPEDLPDTTALPDRLQRLFELLIRYKMARLPSSAKVQIAARLLETENHTRDQVEITVTDDSPGSSPGRAPSSESSASECRLNRTLSSIIACEQGGTLDAHSEEGKGTTFIIRLPVNPGMGSQPSTRN